MSFTLASLNLHCGLDHRGRPFPVKQAVAALDADVVLLQENWVRPDGDSAARSAAADCGYAGYAELPLTREVPLESLEIVRGEVPEETGTWGLAVLSRLPLTEHSPVVIGTAPQDVIGERAAQVVEVAGLRLVNLHLTHRILHGPRQLRRLVAGLAAAGPATAGLPTVIAGDFNMFRPTIALARPYRPVVRGRTFPAARPVLQLDHVLAGPGVRAAAPEVLPTVGSDHLPTRVRLSAGG